MLFFPSLLCSAFPTQVFFIFFFSLFSNTTQNQLRRWTEKKILSEKKKRRSKTKRRQLSSIILHYVTYYTAKRHPYTLSFPLQQFLLCTPRERWDMPHKRKGRGQARDCQQDWLKKKKKRDRVERFYALFKKKKRRTVCSSICNVWKLSRLLKDFSCRYWQCRRDQRPARR